MIPAYASCEICGEYRRAALRRRGGLIICRNCSDTYHQHGVCSVCEQSHPIEDHHIAGRRHSDQTLPVCLNCHADLSLRQYSWHPSWWSSTRPGLFLLQGWWDIMGASLRMRPETGQGLAVLGVIAVLLAIIAPDLFGRLLEEVVEHVVAELGTADDDWSDLVVTDPLP